MYTALVMLLQDRPYAITSHLRAPYFRSWVFFQCKPKRISYELMVDPLTRVTLFDVLPAKSIRTPRLSDCRLFQKEGMPFLHHLTIRGVTGQYFDRHGLDEYFPEARLDSFVYSQGHRYGFEI